MIGPVAHNGGKPQHVPAGTMDTCGEVFSERRGVQTCVRNVLETVWWDAHVPPMCPAAWERTA